jgi:hypothetical protein
LIVCYRNFLRPKELSPAKLCYQRGASIAVQRNMYILQPLKLSINKTLKQAKDACYPWHP